MLELRSGGLHCVAVNWMQDTPILIGAHPGSRKATLYTAENLSKIGTVTGTYEVLTYAQAHAKPVQH